MRALHSETLETGQRLRPLLRLLRHGGRVVEHLHCIGPAERARMLKWICVCSALGGFIGVDVLFEKVLDYAGLRQRTRASANTAWKEWPQQQSSRKRLDVPLPSYQKAPMFPVVAVDCYVIVLGVQT